MLTQNSSGTELLEGFNWTSASGDRSGSCSDAHITGEGPHPFLRLFGDRFQEAVDSAIAAVAAKWEVEAGTDYSGQGDRFARFLLLAPQCDPGASNAKKMILQDWPGLRQMRIALNYLVQQSNSTVALNSKLFLPMIKSEQGAMAGTYFDSASAVGRSV